MTNILSVSKRAHCKNGAIGLSLWPEILTLCLLPFLYTLPGFRDIKYTSHFVAGVLLVSLFWRWMLDPLKRPHLRIVENFGVNNSAAPLLSAALMVWISLGYLQGAANSFASPVTWWIDALKILCACYLTFLLIGAGRLSTSGYGRFLPIFMLALSIYFTTNIVLWLLNFKAISTSLQFMGENRLLGLIGIHTPRVSFPLSSGLNGIAALAVAAFGLGWAFIVTQRSGPIRALATMLIAFSVFVVVMSDSRGAIFGLFFVVLISWIVRSRSLGRFVAPVLTVLPIMPLVIIAFISVIPEGVIYSFFSRGGGQFLTPAAALTTGRSYVWSAVLELFNELSFGLIFGWGIFGHIASGVSVQYAWIFDDPGVTGHTTHSMLLQAFVDRGILGLLLLLTTIFFVARSLVMRISQYRKERIPTTEPLAGLLIAAGLVACGGNEAVLSIYFPDLLLMFCLACAIGSATPFQVGKNNGT